MDKLTNTIASIKAMYQQNPWKGRGVIAGLILIIVLVTARVALPYTIIYAATAWLKDQGITSTIEDISIRVLDGSFTLINARGEKDSGQVFTIGEAAVFWEWRPLSTKTLLINKILLRGFKMDALHYTDSMVIAGIVIPLGAQEPEQKQQKGTNDDNVTWGASLSEISFSDLEVCYKQYDVLLEQSSEKPVIDYCAKLGGLQLEGDFDLVSTETPDSTHAVEATDSVLIEDFAIHNNALDKALITVVEFQLNDIVIKTLRDVRVGAATVKNLAMLQHAGYKDHEFAVEHEALEAKSIHLTDMNNLSIASINLVKPTLSMAKDDKGSWKYEKWLVNTATTEQSAQKLEDNSEIPFTINTGSITISDTEACYEDPATIDYCLNLSMLAWNGDIHIGTPVNNQPLSLGLKGNLSLTSISAMNNLLDRQLLAIESLAMTEANIKDINDVKIGTVKLNKLLALQNTVDSKIHTLTVKAIDVDSVSYSADTLAINTLDLKQPGVTLVKNKDGKFDFENWQIKSDKKSAEKSFAKQKQGKALGFKVNQFSLNTSRPIEFNDNSTTPPMSIGLGKFHIKLSELDSSKPDHNSPIELSAKTTRHGTIDIKGVIKPLAAKPSFNATGTIAGFDLRALSPETEKSLGHKIKSGQLDADLTLLSVDGQLDSNIGLILHHFRLEAISKEDAAALDDMFGMPINQSLILLKDKKDTIKLNIPITGDINNPKFDPTDAIIKATAKATTVTLVTFYTPYGLVYAGGNVLFDLATAINFDPIIYAHGSSQLDETNTGQLEQLATLLKERPQVHLTLCGITSLKDQHKLFPKTKKSEGEIKLEPGQSAKLENLARERQINTKNYLVDSAKIEHNRLILCAPEHRAEPEAVSGVEISIK